MCLAQGPTQAIRDGRSDNSSGITCCEVETRFTSSPSWRRLFQSTPKALGFPIGNPNVAETFAIDLPTIPALVGVRIPALPIRRLIHLSGEAAGGSGRYRAPRSLA
jgi:hypothetical protein